jgi:hypothetical protein
MVSGDTPSDDTLIVLHRHGLLKLWQTDPAVAIACYHPITRRQSRSEIGTLPNAWNVLKPDLF